MSQRPCATTLVIHAAFASSATDASVAGRNPRQPGGRRVHRLHRFKSPTDGRRATSVAAGAGSWQVSADLYRRDDSLRRPTADVEATNEARGSSPGRQNSDLAGAAARQRHFANATCHQKPGLCVTPACAVHIWGPTPTQRSILRKKSDFRPTLRRSSGSATRTSRIRPHGVAPVFCRYSA